VGTAVPNIFFVWKPSRKRPRRSIPRVICRPILYYATSLTFIGIVPVSGTLSTAIPSPIMRTISPSYSACGWYENGTSKTIFPWVGMPRQTLPHDAHRRRARIPKTKKFF
jgi:hypothetical protein